MLMIESANVFCRQNSQKFREEIFLSIILIIFLAQSVVDRVHAVDLEKAIQYAIVTEVANQVRNTKSHCIV